MASLLSARDSGTSRRPGMTKRTSLARRHSRSFRLEIRMNDGAVLGQRGGLDQFVVPVDRERLGRLVDQGLDEREQVAGIEAGGGGRDAAGDIGVADDLDAIDLGDFVRLGAL